MEIKKINLKMKKKFTLGVIFGSALFLGCNTPRQVERHYQQFKAENREKFALDCSDNFRREPELKKGEEKLKIDTVFQPGKTIDCPPPDQNGKSSVQCPPNEKIINWKTRIDTFVVPDAAKEEALRLGFERMQIEVSKEKAHTAAAIQRAEKAESSSRRKSKIIWGIGIFFGLLALLKLKKFI